MKLGLSSRHYLSVRCRATVQPCYRYIIPFFFDFVKTIFCRGGETLEKSCNICPRECKADRSAGEIGYCGCPSDAVVSHVSRHFFEEPPISGKNGSGTVFFGGCNLRCVFCQNRDISRSVEGKHLNADSLSELFLEIADSGVHNVNLVTPTPYAPVIAGALEKVKHRINVPIVYNTSSYEKAEVIDMLSGLVYIYLPDIKYFADELSVRYSNAPRYAEVAFSALERMLSQHPKFVLDENGILKKGVIVRHLCLPSASKDSINLLDRLSRYLDKYDFRLSLMSQYTPDFLGEISEKYKEINRRVTSLEYNRVLNAATSLGFDGYFQGREAASAKYTPNFDPIAFGEREIIEI